MKPSRTTALTIGLLSLLGAMLVAMAGVVGCTINPQPLPPGPDPTPTNPDPGGGGFGGGGSGKNGGDTGSAAVAPEGGAEGGADGGDAGKGDAS